MVRALHRLRKAKLKTGPLAAGATTTGTGAVGCAIPTTRRNHRRRSLRHRNTRGFLYPTTPLHNRTTLLRPCAAGPPNDSNNSTSTNTCTSILRRRVRVRFWTLSTKTMAKTCRVAPSGRTCVRVPCVPATWNFWRRRMCNNTSNSSRSRAAAAAAGARKTHPVP